MIPWTISQQFQDPEFPALSGARVVRIAAHPDMHRAGYGSRALELLRRYYQGDLADLVRLPVHARPVIPTSVMWRQGNRVHCLARLCFVKAAILKSMCVPVTPATLVCCCDEKDLAVLIDPPSAFDKALPLHAYRIQRVNAVCVRCPKRSHDTEVMLLLGRTMKMMRKRPSLGARGTLQPAAALMAQPQSAMVS